MFKKFTKGFPDVVRKKKILAFEIYSISQSSKKHNVDIFSLVKEMKNLTEVKIELMATYLLERCKNSINK